MRVLITTGLYPPEVGGPATYSAVLEKELPRSAIAVTVLPFNRVRRAPVIIRHIWYFFLVLREGKEVDIVYAQDPVSVGLPAFLGAFFLRKTFLLKVVGDYAWEQSVQRFDFTGTVEEFQHAELLLIPQMLRALERFVARRAKRVIVPSRYLGRIVAEWGVPKKKLSVIYNGMEELDDAGNKSVLRGLLRFNGKLIVSIGRLVPWKGFKELIGIVARLKKDIPELKLMIIGAGPDAVFLEKEAENKGLAEDVIFTGALPRDVLLRYVRASDVFILNTRYEGFSHQLLEVMAVGVPIITTKVGGNAEAIEHDKSGFLVAPNDAARIEGHARSLLSDASLCLRITTAAKRKVKQFSNERMMDETVKLLKTL